MPTKRPSSRTPRPTKAELRVDVTRIEYQRLCDVVNRNAEAIKRLELADQIQFRRTVELQQELDALKQAHHAQRPR